MFKRLTSLLLHISLFLANPTHPITMSTEQVQSSFRLFGTQITLQTQTQTQTSSSKPESSMLESGSRSTLTLLDHANASHPERRSIKIFGAMIYLEDTQSKETSSHAEMFNGKGVLPVDDSNESNMRRGKSQVVENMASTSSTMGGKGFHVPADSQRLRKRKGKSRLVDNMMASTSSTMGGAADSQRCTKRRRHILATPQPVAVRDRRGMNHDRFNIRKVLTTSDVNANARLIVPTNLVGDLILPKLSYQNQLDLKDSEKGLLVSINDLDTHSQHTLKFKLQLKTNCYILISNWRETFVRRRILCKGDEIGMVWNSNNLSFDFTVLRRATPWALVLYSAS